MIIVLHKVFLSSKKMNNLQKRHFSENENFMNKAKRKMSEFNTKLKSEKIALRKSFEEMKNLVSSKKPDQPISFRVLIYEAIFFLKPTNIYKIFVLANQKSHILLSKLRKEPLIEAGPVNTKMENQKQENSEKDNKNELAYFKSRMTESMRLFDHIKNILTNKQNGNNKTVVENESKNYFSGFSNSYFNKKFGFQAAQEFLNRLFLKFTFFCCMIIFSYSFGKHLATGRSNNKLSEALLQLNSHEVLRKQESNN